MNQKEKYIRYKQDKINKLFISNIIINLIVIFSIMIVVLMFEINSMMLEVRENNKIEEGSKPTVNESEIIFDHITVVPPANASKEEEKVEIIEPTIEPEVKEPETEIEIIEPAYCRNLSDEDKYLLAKIAMAEAEGESLESKVMVILVVLNRVESEKRYFPDTVEEVIFQNSNGVYQFTPIGNGRWDRVEPNRECWEAVEYVNNNEDNCSQGALYFEACNGESWHSRNLELICQIGKTRFYK